MVVATTPRLGDAVAMRYFGDGSTFSPAELAASFPPLIEEYTRFGYGNYDVVERATNRILGHCGA